MRSALIVDAYSSGNLLCQELKKRNFRVLHLQSTKEIPHGYKASFKPETFDARYVLNANEPIKVLLRHLHDENIHLVIAGAESGVLLSDLISSRLNLKTNGTILSKARRNKFEMLERVKSLEIKTPLQALHTEVEIGKNWAEKHCDFPIVLKPVESAGTDSVFICNSYVEIETAFNLIMGKVNLLGTKNENVLFQEFLKGTEHAINTISQNGSFFTSSVWQYRKTLIPGTEVIFYDRDILITPDSVPFKVLDQFSKKVLSASGISFGPAHIEVMLTESGPVLIELGARISGVTMPELDEITILHGQIELTIDAYTDENAFDTKIKKPRQLLKHTELITTFSFREGIVKDCKGLDQIRFLDSYFSERIKFRAGDFITPTRNIFSSPGFIILIHDDPEQIFRDYCEIRRIEKEGLFTIA